MRTVLCCSIILATAQCLASDGSMAFENFKIVKERNIFDANRKKYTPPASKQESTAPPDPVKREPPPVLSLTGVLIADGTAEVFITASRADLGGVFTVGDLVGGLTINRADTDGIEVSAEQSSTLQWDVGTSIQKEGGQWQYTDSAANTAVSAPKPHEPEAPQQSADDHSTNDILKLLQERRRKELSK